MGKHKRPKLDEESTNNYFKPESKIEFVSTGCTKLDCDLGGGYCLGRIANIVGDKCLSGDTIISAVRGVADSGRKMTMKTLFSRFKGNHPNKGTINNTRLIADVGGYVGSIDMVDIVMSGEKVLYEIINDRGQIIKASEDHKFSTPNGWACLSDDLGIGSITKCWRGTRNKEGPERNRKYRASTSGVVFHPFGQKNVVAGKDYKRILTARLVIEAAINGMSLIDFISVLKSNPELASTLHYTDPDLDVHHLDGDCTNDRLDNLQLINPIEHWEVHAAEMPQHTKSIDLSEIVSIRKVGIEETFDITMTDPHHNFIANGFVVHNSTAKTALATEAVINFLKQYPDGNAFYRETEAAFLSSYAAKIGLPLDKVDFGDPDKPVTTVEEFAKDLSVFINKQTATGKPGIYILDSLDALSDDAEMDRDIGEGTFGMAKAKAMSILFRTVARKLERTKILLVIVSQVRDKIGVMFGEKHTRSGGRALDFYASQIVWLSKIKDLKRSIKGIERSYGVIVRAKIKKNKVSAPGRECDFEFHYSYGIEDFLTSYNWLHQVKRLPEEYAKLNYENMSDSDYRRITKEIGEDVKKAWTDIEQDFMPKRSKYG